MDVVVARCAGIDVGKAQLAVTVRVPVGRTKRTKKIRKSFGTTSAQLLALHEFLAEHQVTRVGMESTSSYWKPVYYMLEDTFETWLLNARHMRNVPGRKTDASDADWICELVAHGLVRPSFVPPPPIRVLRDLTRRRSLLLRERTREKQRLEKVLEDAQIKLSVVASDVFGVSGRMIIEKLIAGERDATLLAEYTHGQLRNKRAALAEALVGRFNEHHAFLCTQILTHVDAIDAWVAQLDERIAAELTPYAAQVRLLDTIPGVDVRAAQVIIAEIGLDMTQFPTAAHLASWAGLCPGNNQTGGKTRPGRTRPGDKWLRGVLGAAARSVSRSRSSYLSAQYRRIATRRGGNRATVAVAHSMLTAAWHILTHQVGYHDLGPDYFLNRQDPNKRRKHLTANLERLGYQVTLTPLTQPGAA